MRDDTNRKPMSTGWHQDKPTRAHGTAESNGRRIAVTFPTDEFDRIRDLAQASGVAFQEQVRRMCRAYKPGTDQ